MKKLFNLLMVALMAVCFAVPAMGKAEAAKVVVLPLVNNSGSETAGQIYISGAIQLFDYPEYELLEMTLPTMLLQLKTLVKTALPKTLWYALPKHPVQTLLSAWFLIPAKTTRYSRAQNAF